ncbi:acyl-CoA dehydrogenase family protein [Streptomyces sp. Ru72]|uniref:acyl-CoA dehydrogenase family protein n=1 Tax=Streptomyces sp. Ru72 TaxID=2080747 RepID=UPI000CDD1C16|nr:acyl-CoA dehydrogenase family protein [Streptomyces sp. Ru72]POX46808.1 acyl-CoA dehydrogenase [Streptomyces sp. Ru72]
MHLDYTPEQQRLRNELRGYFARLVPAGAYARHTDPAEQKRFYRDTIRRLGGDGWLGVGWPKEYGGRGMTAMEQFVFFDEAAQAGVPLPLMSLNTVGPTLIRFGTDEQKDYFLPRILSGEIDFAIGYSEPGAGTDLASLKTRAVREGEVYVVNGQKIWTVSRRVGEENHGWRLITNQFNHERVTLAAHGTMAVRALHDVQRWATETTLTDGRRVIDLSWVRRRLALTHTKLDAMKLLNWQMVSAVEEGTLTPQEASAVKVYGSEARRDAYAWLMEVLAAAGPLKEGSAGAALHGELERGYRSAVIFTFGGGNNEIQHEIISWIGLGMPRVRR